MYAIAIDTSPLDYSDRVFKTRFWGSDNKTYVWTSHGSRHRLHDQP